MKYKRVDQLALARALQKTGIKIKTLEKTYNYPVVSNSPKSNQSIYHLIYKKEIAKKTNMWDPCFDDPIGTSMAEAFKAGSRAENHYLHIGQRIYNSPGASTLVICPGGDEAFWRYCAKENVKFVIPKQSLHASSDENICAYRFDSRVGHWVSAIDIPDSINRSYAYVVVNGPGGFNQDCPGRQLPIAWASKLATKAVYVFDYNREWERAVCDHYLGNPALVLDPVGKGNAVLAEFKI